MYARVTLIEADNEGLTRWQHVVGDRIAPGATATAGFVEGIWMRDDDAGIGLAITIWANKQAMMEAEKSAVANRARLEQATGGSIKVLTGPIVEHRYGTTS